jgi:DNA-binding response OmpR family regulator
MGKQLPTQVDKQAGKALSQKQVLQALWWDFYWRWRSDKTLKDVYVYRLRGRLRRRL